MKKIIAAILCLLFLFCGCSKAAVPFYENENELITLTSLYNYSFSDDDYILCVWKNGTDKELYFYDTFSLEKKTSGGNWTVVDKFGNAEFNTNYCHSIDPGMESMARYDLDLFTDSLSNNTTYRISTFCYDDEDNHYQVYSEFICDDEAAEEEILALSQSALEGSEEESEDSNASSEAAE